VHDSTNDPSTTTAVVPSRTGPHAIDYALLGLLASLWGLSFILIKVGVTSVSPETLTAMRLVCAASVMWLALAMTGARLPLDRQGLLLAGLVATFGAFLPFLLISWGQVKTDTGLTAILMGVMPLATILIAHFTIADDRMTGAKALGVALGFIGVVVLIGPEKLLALGSETVRQIAIATAAVCYGASAVMTRRMMGTRSQIGLATMIMTIAAGLAVTLAFWRDGLPEALPPPGPLAAIVCLGVVQTGLAQILLFQIVARQGASFFSQINFLVPLLGAFWGVVLLGEHLPLGALAALGFILSGLAVSRLR